MGKYIFLVIMAVTLGTTLLASQGMQTDQDTSESQSARQEKVLARQIANSAFEMGTSELRRDYEGWRVDRNSVSHEGGSYDVSATGPPNGPVWLEVFGRYGDALYKLTANVIRDTETSSLFNAITTLTPIDYDVAGGGCSGSPCISGLDEGGRIDRHGISTPPGEDTNDICDEFDDKVVGKADGCDVWSRTDGEDEWVHREMNTIESQIQNVIDAGSDQVTTCDGCRAGDLSTDRGILYVTGELRFDGNEQWNGLVYVADGGSVRINGGGHTRNINGGLLVSDNTDFENGEVFNMNGGNSVVYNSDQLKKLFNTLPAARTKMVKITDRSGGFLQDEE